MYSFTDSYLYKSRADVVLPLIIRNDGKPYFFAITEFTKSTTADLFAIM